MYAHVCFYACMHVFIYVFMHACLYACRYSDIFVCMHMYISMHVCRYAGMQVYVYACMSATCSLTQAHVPLRREVLPMSVEACHLPTTTTVERRTRSRGRVDGSRRRRCDRPRKGWWPNCVALHFRYHSLASRLSCALHRAREPACCRLPVLALALWSPRLWALRGPGSPLYSQSALAAGWRRRGALGLGAV